MFRSILIYLSNADWAKRMVIRWRVARRAASRFVAGTSIDEALAVVREYNAKGINATLDYLGEYTTNHEEALKATRDILELLFQVRRYGVRTNVSIKLTQIGLALNKNLCFNNLENILSCAKLNDNFIRIDMEDSSCTDKSIHLYRLMRQKGYDCVGLVVQSYLLRSKDDTHTLLKDGTRLRLVKGAYNEPHDIAFTRKADVNMNFDVLTKLLINAAISFRSPSLSSNGRTPPLPAIATHDEKRINFALTYMEEVGLPKQALEFQMLFGIRRDLQYKLARQGYNIRVYIPYGTNWYSYFMRRLAERPANLWFFFSNLFR